MKKFRRFKLSLTGYNKKEVDEYIFKIQTLNNESLALANQNVNILEEEIKQLKRELKSKESREEEVTEAIIAATNRAKELENAWKQRYALEVERIRLFRNKWESFIEEKKLKLPAKDRCDKVTGQLYAEERELIKMMKESFNLSTEANHINPVNAQYLDESKRLIDKLKNVNLA